MTIDDVPNLTEAELVEVLNSGPATATKRGLQPYEVVMPNGKKYGDFTHEDIVQHKALLDAVMERLTKMHEGKLTELEMEERMGKPSTH